MAISSGEIKLVLPNNAFVDSVTPTGTTNTITKKAIGGYTKSKFLTYEIEVGLGGALTSHQIIGSLLGTTPLTIGVHDLQLNGAIASDFSVSISSDDAVTFDSTLQVKNTETVTPGTPTVPNDLFSKAEATIALNKQAPEFNSIDISASRDVSPVYGGTGSIVQRMYPSDFRIGTWEYSVDVEIAPEDISSGFKLWNPTDNKWSLSILFIDAVNASHTLGLCLTGMMVTESSPDISAEEVSSSWSLTAESFYYGEVGKETFTGDGSTTEFTLTNTPGVVESIIVTIDNQVVSNWTYTSATKKITFDTAPDNNKSIAVMYIKQS
jgi:hypothetical protein